MIVSGVAPPMVDAVRRVRRCMSRRVFCRFCHARSRVPIVFGPFHYCAFRPDPAPAKWLGPITPTVYINDSTLTETKPFCLFAFLLSRFKAWQPYAAVTVDKWIPEIHVLPLFRW